METHFSKEFGKKIEKLLEQQQLTKQQAAEKMGCSCVTLRSWIRGRVPFSIHMLRQLHELFGVDLNKLLED